MVARRYVFYVRAARTISHSFAALAREISFLPREHKIHIFELTCNVLFYYIDILMTAFLTFFRRFPTTFRTFPKIPENLSEGYANVAEHFPKIFQDARRLPKTFREDPKMFCSYTNELKNHLRDKLIDILTSESMKNTPLESRM